MFFFFFFFNDTATTEIYTLSLHDALPISAWIGEWGLLALGGLLHAIIAVTIRLTRQRSEEHTSELQSRLHLVCRLLLEKKKKNYKRHHQSSVANKCTSRSYDSRYTETDA